MKYVSLYISTTVIYCALFSAGCTNGSSNIYRNYPRSGGRTITHVDAGEEYQLDLYVFDQDTGDSLPNALVYSVDENTILGFTDNKGECTVNLDHYWGYISLRGAKHAHHARPFFMKRLKVGREDYEDYFFQVDETQIIDGKATIKVYLIPRKEDNQSATQEQYWQFQTSLRGRHTCLSPQRP